MAETVAANKKINTTILLVATMATHFFNPFMLIIIIHIILKAKQFFRLLKAIKR